MEFSLAGLFGCCIDRCSGASTLEEVIFVTASHVSFVVDDRMFSTAQGNESRRHVYALDDIYGIII